jgi:hypothetical protein
MDDVEIGKTRRFWAWITEPEMVVFRGVRLGINSLGAKKDDIIRQLINELASTRSWRCWLFIRGLCLNSLMWNKELLIDCQSLDHSWATGQS